VIASRFRRSPVGAVALTGLVLALGGWGVLNSPMFATRRIVVHGTHHLTTSQVIDAAGVPSGENLVLLSTEEVAGKVEAIPWVVEAVAERDLPSAVVIRVVERTAAGWFRDSQGVVVVARDGTVLERVDRRPEELPGLGPWSAVLEAGDRIPAGEFPLRVVASMSGALRRMISAGASTGSDVDLELRGGGTVQYGPPTRLSEKNAALLDMLDWASEEEIAVGTIDLRIPDAPTLHPASSQDGSLRPPQSLL
jgi:cell division protein FtsQ